MQKAKHNKNKKLSNMEDIEIEYLDEYKDLVLPGINKSSGEGRAATSASLDQTMSRLPQRRRTSSDSSSSSIDPDIFQKLFDGKLFDDELLNESGSSAKGILRRSLSSSSSDSNDALDALYNRQSSRKIMTKKRNRLESYDSLDDLGDALMGSNHKLSLHKTNSSFASKKAPGLQRVTSVVKSKSADKRTPLNKASSSSVINAKAGVSRANGGSSSSSSSNHQLLANRKKAVTIIKAQKPDLKPPKHEPRMDPLHLQDFADDSDSGSSFEYESDSYGDSDEDDGAGAGAKQIIDISTDTSATPSVTGNKQKQMMQTKLSMAPPATPNRELIIGKAVLRRPGNPSDNDVQPEQKKPKLGGHFVELKTKANDNKHAPSVLAVIPKTGTGNANAAQKSLTIESPKKAELTQGSPVLGQKPEAPKPPVKSSLSAFLKGISRPTTMDNSVIITKTAVGKTTDQLKRSDVSPSKVTAASGINISVSVVADANKQLKTPPKKILTQTETGKKVMTMTATTTKETTSGSGDNESQPAAGTSKETKAKAEKRSTLPAKMAVPQEESNTTSLPPAKTAEKRRKPNSKLAAVENPVEAAPAPTKVKAIVTAATESLQNVKLDKKLESRKIPRKSASKAKSKETVSVQAAEAGVTTVERAASSVSSSRESSRERSKRAKGAVKSMPTEAGVTTVEQAASSVCSSRESSRERAKRATAAVKAMSTVTRATIVARAAPTSSTAPQLSPLPQRQPRRSQALKLVAAETRTRPRTPPVLPVAAAAPSSVPAEEPMPAASHSRKRKLPATSTAGTTAASKRVKESVAFPVRITAASAVLMPAAAGESSPAAAAAGKQVELQLPRLRKCLVRINRRPFKNWLAKQQQRQEVNAAPAAPPPAAQAKETQNKTAGKSLPLPEPLLPVPLPVLEVKQETTTTQSEDTNRLETNVATPSPTQVVAPTPRTVALLQNADNNSGNNDNNTTSEVPASGSSSNDVHTFGTTRMFSFLYPSRYQRSYGNVGLDFCCPNLDGPMQAIDPTRLHSKVEVPVLELPQYMVISTKIISKQDKNIPPKVRAKLEQLAAKDGIPCVMQSVQISTSTSSSSIPSDPVPTTPAPAIIQTPPVASPMERVTKPLPRGPIQTKTAAATSAAVAPTVVNTPAVSDIYPGLLQLPPVCPTDKMRVELQTRVQLFDAVLQGLARRAVSLSVAERQRIIENIVSTSSLMPIDVDVGTKLLENYICYLNAATDTITLPVPRVRSIVTTMSATPAVSQGTKSKVVKTTQVKPATGNSRPPPLAAISGRKAGGGGGTAAKGEAGAGEPNRRPIYDKDKKNIIGYQYKSQQTTVSPATRLIDKSSSSRSSSDSAVAAPRLTMMPTARTAPNATSNKLAVVSAVSSPRASTSLKTYTASRTPTVSASSRNPAANNAGGSKLFIVNQILTHPEECILPDGVGTTDPVALETEIKGEVEDADSLI